MSTNSSQIDQLNKTHANFFIKFNGTTNPTQSTQSTQPTQPDHPNQRTLTKIIKKLFLQEINNIMIFYFSPETLMEIRRSHQVGVFTTHEYTKNDEDEGTFKKWVSSPDHTPNKELLKSASRLRYHHQIPGCGGETMIKNLGPSSETWSTSRSIIPPIWSKQV